AVGGEAERRADEQVFLLHILRLLLGADVLRVQQRIAQRLVGLVEFLDPLDFGGELVFVRPNSAAGGGERQQGEQQPAHHGTILTNDEMEIYILMMPRAAWKGGYLNPRRASSARTSARAR